MKRTISNFLKDGIPIETGSTADPRPSINRLRGKTACIDQIEEAMKEGIAPEDLLQSVQAYANDSTGFTCSKVCFSDNWLQSRRWQPYFESQQAERELSAVTEADHHTRLACWISGSHRRFRTTGLRAADHCAI